MSVDWRFQETGRAISSKSAKLFPVPKLYPYVQDEPVCTQDQAHVRNLSNPTRKLEISYVYFSQTLSVFALPEIQLYAIVSLPV